MLTLGTQYVSVIWCCHAELLGRAKASAVQEDRQVDNVAHVVVAVYVGVPQHAVQVLIDGFDDDMGVTGKDRDEGTLGEKDPHLYKNGFITGPKSPLFTKFQHI